MHFVDWIYILDGIMGGLIVGILGTGSSLVVLPVLVFLFQAQFNSPFSIKIAIGTCLAIITIGSTVASFSQIKKKYVNKTACMIVSVFYLIGGLLGPWMAHFIPIASLHVYVGLMVLLIASSFFPPFVSAVRKFPKRLRVPSFLEMPCVACVIAIASSIAGVASGLFMIPYLRRFMEYRQAIGTSLAASTVYCLASTEGYLMAGSHIPGQLPSNTWGYIYWPAFLMVGIPMALLAPLGTWLSHKISTLWLERVFIVFLVLAGFY